MPATTTRRLTQLLPSAPSGWTHIAKVNSVTATNIAKINGVAVAGIAKVSGVAV